MGAPPAAFPLDKEVIEGYFDNDPGRAAYLRMADLLEQVHREAPRDDPFAPGFKPHFNWLKFFALIGIHAMDAIHLDPARFAKLCPPFASFAGRIWGYIQKAKVSKEQVARWEEKLRRFVLANPACDTDKNRVQ